MVNTTKLPGIYLHESVETLNYEDTGQIPVFVGKTDNASGDGSQMHKYYGFDEAAKSTADGGIGQTGNIEEDLKVNPLLNVLKKFFEESAATVSADADIPYIYVVDVGAGTSINAWRNALNVVDLEHDIHIEAYYGLEYLESSMQSFIDEINAHLTKDAKLFMFRRAYITIVNDLSNDEGIIDDDDIIALAQANLSVNRLRVVDPQVNDAEGNSLAMKTVDPYIFGQHVGRVCVTPVGYETGYYSYNTISPGIFCKRTVEECEKLMNAGVIFAYDEYYKDAKRARMNLNIATSFGNNPNARPADCFDYSRRICDYILLEVYNACYPFIKTLETRTNITILQTKVNLIISNAVDNGLLVEYSDKNTDGSYLQLEESDSDPFTMIVKGKLQTVKEIVAIDVETTITSPAMQDTEAD